MLHKHYLKDTLVTVPNKTDLQQKQKYRGPLTTSDGISHPREDSATIKVLMKGIAGRNSWMRGMFVWTVKHSHFLASADFWALRKHAPQGCHMAKSRVEQTSFGKAAWANQCTQVLFPLSALCQSVSEGSCHIKMCSAPAFLLCGCRSETSVWTRQIPLVWRCRWIREKGCFRWANLLLGGQTGALRSF